MDLNKTPQSGPAWIAHMNAWKRHTNARLTSVRTIPVGGMVLWAGGGTPPAGWLTANGATFSSTTYPLLAARLGTTTLPAPAAVSGITWIVRAL